MRVGDLMKDPQDPFGLTGQEIGLSASLKPGTVAIPPLVSPV